MLDAVEDVINKAGPCTVIVHYPVDHHWWVRSTSGRTFAEIMESPNINVIFSGHFHPTEPMVIHHGQGGVEYVGSGAYQHSRFGVVTIDNGRFVYNTIKFTDVPVKFLIIHPIPLEQVSSHQSFNAMDTEIRVLVYLSPTLTIKCSGSVKGTLKYARTLKNGAHLYSLPIGLSQGNHSITLTCTEKNWTETRKFVIAATFKGFPERTPCSQRAFLAIKLCGIPLFLVLLWILWPCPGLESKATERWICGESRESHWFACIFLGPNCTRTRILALPKSVRLVLFGSLLWPVFLPLHFFKPIYGRYGWAFFCFIVIGRAVLFDDWAVHMSMFYLLLVVVPGVQVATAASVRESRPNLFYFICLKSLVWFAGLSLINYRWVGESVVWPLLFVNPSYVLIPLFLYVFLYLKVFRKTMVKGASFEMDGEPVETTSL
jgi:hypothetical protein